MTLENEELEGLTKEIRRLIESNREFLERVEDEEFDADGDEAEEEETEPDGEEV